PSASRSAKVATTPGNGAVAVGALLATALPSPPGPDVRGKPLAIGTGSAKAQSSTLTRLLVAQLAPPDLTVAPSNLKTTPWPRVSRMLVTIGWVNSAPAKICAPAVALVGTFNVSRTVLSWKKVRVVPGCCTFWKTAPRPRAAADTSAVLGALGATNL